MRKIKGKMSVTGFFPLLVQFFRLMVVSEELPREAVIISIAIFPLFQGKQVEDDMMIAFKCSFFNPFMLLHNYYVKGIKLKGQRLDVTKA